MAPLGGINSGISLPLELLDAGSTRGAVKATPGAEETSGAGSFSAVLKDKLTALNSQQVDAASATQDMATGNVDDVAQTMVRIEQANVSLQMATQVRNKVIEAYQEVLRMQM